MTVLENVVSPLPTASWGLMAKDAVSGHEAERARELLDFVGLGRFGDQQAGALSYGQQKLVELAQVLMLEPKMILLDEPAGGINPTLINRMVEIIRDLNKQGIAFLVVEHNIPLVLDLCDPVARAQPRAGHRPGAAVDRARRPGRARGLPRPGVAARRAGSRTSSSTSRPSP